VLVILGLSSAINGQSATEDYIYHPIKKGESLSLICIQYYGHYTNDLGGAVKQLNSSIKDINVIVAGDKLKLAKPSDPSKKTDKPAIFEKKMKITQGVVTCVEGTAHLFKKGKKEKSLLTVNTLVYPGDILQTDADGRVEVIINRESVIRMNTNSRLVFGQYRDTEKEKGATTVDLDNGTLWTKVKKFADKVSRFQLNLPTAVAGVYGTVYETSVADDSTTEIKVYNGEVSVTSPSAGGPEQSGDLSEVAGPSEIPGPQEVSLDEWVRIVRSMQKVVIGRDGAPSEVTAFKKDPANTWEQWNEQRDTRIAELFSEK